MSETLDQPKTDVLADKAFMSKRSFRKIFVNKPRYVPNEKEFIPHSKGKGKDLTLHTAGKATSAICAKGLQLSLGLGPITHAALQEENECEGVDTIQTAGCNPGEECRVKLDESGAETKLELEPDNMVKEAKSSEPSAKAQFIFSAMRRRSVEGDMENRPYKCPCCKWAFKKSSNLLSHVKTHSGLKPHICELCGKAYAHQGTLQQHKRLHTGERPYCCPFCNKTYTWSSDYRKHIRTHTGEKPYGCSECGKEFVRSSDLRKHERNTHSNNKPFLCSTCGKTFNKPLALLRHERKHLGERPFVCADCGKAFSLPSRLVEHKKIHSGLRPYPCPVCPKSFTKSSNLTEHLSVHTGFRPHTCTECGVAFAMPSRLLRHQRTHTARHLQYVNQPPV